LKKLFEKTFLYTSSYFNLCIMSVDYVLKKTKAKALLEKALLPSVVENPIPYGSGKTELVIALNPLQRKPKHRLHCKSWGLSLKQKETINSRYSSLTTAILVKPRGELIDASEEVESASSVEVFEKPANNDQGDENSDYSSFPQISASDSEISDWRDQFSFPESDSVLNAEKSFSDSTDSCSYSLGTKSSRSTRGMLKPMCIKPKDLLPAGMLFVGSLNTKIGNRFKTFQLDAKLQTVIDWLGAPLAIVIQEPGRGGRRCDSYLTLAQALGKMLKSPSQQGIAFFTGPVNGKLSYLMTIVDLHQLCALKASEDKELEKLTSWL